MFDRIWEDFPDWGKLLLAMIVLVGGMIATNTLASDFPLLWIVTVFSAPLLALSLARKMITSIGYPNAPSEADDLLLGIRKSKLKKAQYASAITAGFVVFLSLGSFDAANQAFITDYLVPRHGYIRNELTEDGGHRQRAYVREGNTMLEWSSALAKVLLLLEWLSVTAVVSHISSKQVDKINSELITRHGYKL